jgi:hypothetical protein
MLSGSFSKRLFKTQLFKTNCKESDLVAIFKMPRRNVDLGYRYLETSSARVPEAQLMSETDALQLQLTKLIAESRSNLLEQQSVSDLLQKAGENGGGPKEVEQKAKPNRFVIRQTGNVCFSLHAKYHKKFCHSWDVKVPCVALGVGFILLGMDGKATNQDVPTNLVNKLRGRKSTDSPLVYIALGSEERYFVRFADGEWQAVGSDSLV